MYANKGRHIAILSKPNEHIEIYPYRGERLIFIVSNLWKRDRRNMGATEHFKKQHGASVLNLFKLIYLCYRLSQN